MLVKKVDARGYSCPQPVLITKKSLEENPEAILIDNTENALKDLIKNL